MVYTHNTTGQDTLLTDLNESTKAIWGDTENWKFSKRETITIVPQILHSIQQFEPSISVDGLTTVEKEFAPIAEILENNQAQYIDVIRSESTRLNSSHV